MAMTQFRILGGRSSKLMQIWLYVGTRMDVAAEQAAFKTKVFTPTRRSAGLFALSASRSVKARLYPWCLCCDGTGFEAWRVLENEYEGKRWKRSRCGESKYTVNDLPLVLVATVLAHAPASGQEWTIAQRTCDVLGRLAAPETSAAMKIEQV